MLNEKRRPIRAMDCAKIIQNLRGGCTRINHTQSYYFNK